MKTQKRIPFSNLSTIRLSFLSLWILPLLTLISLSLQVHAGSKSTGLLGSPDGNQPAPMSFEQKTVQISEEPGIYIDPSIQESPMDLQPSVFLQSEAVGLPPRFEFLFTNAKDLPSRNPKSICEYNLANHLNLNEMQLRAQNLCSKEFTAHYQACVIESIEELRTRPDQYSSIDQFCRNRDFFEVHAQLDTIKKSPLSFDETIRLIVKDPQRLSQLTKLRNNYELSEEQIAFAEKYVNLAPIAKCYSDLVKTGKNLVSALNTCQKRANLPRPFGESYFLILETSDGSKTRSRFYEDDFESALLNTMAAIEQWENLEISRLGIRSEHLLNRYPKNLSTEICYHRGNYNKCLKAPELITKMKINCEASQPRLRLNIRFTALNPLSKDSEAFSVEYTRRFYFGSDAEKYWNKVYQQGICRY